MPKQTRNRQLARQVARRRAQRRQQQRRRQMATVAVALVIALVGSVVLFSAFVAGNGETTASPSPDRESPAAEPGTRTGTVEPEPGPSRVACGAEAPRGALRPKPQFNEPADVIEQGTTYTATFETSCGDVVVRLLANRAPETVNSFVFLAEQGYFDGTRIHRIDEAIDVLQGGDPTGRGDGGPGYSIPDELRGNETYPPGTLAMANAGPDTGGSQFFLIAGPNGHGLDANPAFTIFGRVIEGLVVAKEILGLPIQDPDAAAAGDISAQQPAQAVYIERVTISTREP